MTKDMTQGSPLKLILAFAVPLMLGSLFQQFYNLADTIIVGRFVGVEALAAVGSVGGLNYLVLGFVNCLRLLPPHLMDIRCERLCGDAPLHRQCRLAECLFCCSAYRGHSGYDPFHSGLDQYPGQHH